MQALRFACIAALLVSTPAAQMGVQVTGKANSARGSSSSGGSVMLSVCGPATSQLA